MLSNFELFDMSKTYKVKLDDVVYKNDLKKINMKTNMNVIINLDNNSVKSKGTHWVCYVKRKNDMLYFDSFGAGPPLEVLQYSKGLRKSYNEYIVQDLDSSRCGSYCFALLHYIKYNKGKLYDVANDFINLFEDNAEKNDQILNTYFDSNNMTMK